MKRWMTLFLALALCLSIAPAAFAAYAPEDLKVLGKKEIAALTEEHLIDNYVDVLVELEAIKTFHTTSGFTPAQYNNYKDILKYRFLLLMEIHQRKLALPPSVE